MAAVVEELVQRLPQRFVDVDLDSVATRRRSSVGCAPSVAGGKVWHTHNTRSNALKLAFVAFAGCEAAPFARCENGP